MTGGLWTTDGAGLGALLRQPMPQTATRQEIALAPTPDQVAYARAILAAHKRAVGAIAIRPAKPAGNTYRGFDDFMPARSAACRAAILAHGPRWYLVPGAMIEARVPTAWVRWKGRTVSGSSPRDMHMPAARYWQAGTLPVGPEYAAPAVLSGDVMPRRIVPISHRLSGPAAAPAPVLELAPCEWDDAPEWRDAAD